MGKGIHWELCKKLKFDHTVKYHYYKPESVLENETRNSLGFLDTNRSPNPGQKIRPSYKNKNITCRIVDFALRNENQRKRKERPVACQRTKKKKLWTMKVTVISLVIGLFGMVLEGSEKGLKELEIGEAETIQATTLLRSARILLDT